MCNRKFVKYRSKVLGLSPRFIVPSAVQKQGLLHQDSIVQWQDEQSGTGFQIISIQW